ncbi:MAG: hypothetical protein A3F72_19685 [Bacteroidetes bacterium RIFCSPLOWO2_12_FULL_35_15]|nr:MAG: hypothetical protein A3F72_19685 [Bacteroidetes bacterium RIFCSPLOWO2_12_FULL_35_15]
MKTNQNFNEFKSKLLNLLIQKIDSNEINLTHEQVFKSSIKFIEIDDKFVFMLDSKISKEIPESIYKELEELFKNR